MFLHGVREVWALAWNDTLSYGDILKQPEIDHCRYAFNSATIKRLRGMYSLTVHPSGRRIALAGRFLRLFSGRWQAARDR